MRKLAIAAIAAGTLLSGLTASSHAEGEPIIGSVCGFSSTNDETGVVDQDPTHQYGEIDGGPLVLAELGDAFPISVPPAVPPAVPTTPPSPASGHLYCWLQNTANYNFLSTTFGYPGLAGADAAGVGVVALTAAIQYNLAPWGDVYLCSWVHINGGSDWLYDENWTDPDTGQKTGNLVKSTQVPPPVCSLAISAG